MNLILYYSGIFSTASCNTIRHFSSWHLNSCSQGLHAVGKEATPTYCIPGGVDHNAEDVSTIRRISRHIFWCDCDTFVGWGIPTDPISDRLSPVGIAYPISGLRWRRALANTLIPRGSKCIVANAGVSNNRHCRVKPAPKLSASLRQPADYVVGIIFFCDRTERHRRIAHIQWQFHSLLHYPP